MKHAALFTAALMLGLSACNDQPDEALPPEGDLEGALPADEEAGEDTVEGEPDLETIGEPEAPTMESGSNPPGTTAPPQGSKLQKADPDY
ncbi:hypothetical protein [Erythrobacter sp.]|uniref:hypothetical protein n=1 Tax=Erythrobacter sp. TaxID=1042 RepID=UPI001425CED4|nr:hypothetical protein [Erythrobacter sp.]QIQ87940.1 MAG: hypothetical protein G9473_15485 [Erythrobacter sp.]